MRTGKNGSGNWLYGLGKPFFWLAESVLLVILFLAFLVNKLFISKLTLSKNLTGKKRSLYFSFARVGAFVVALVLRIVNQLISKVLGFTTNVNGFLKKFDHRLRQPIQLQILPKWKQWTKTKLDWRLVKPKFPKGRLRLRMSAGWRWLVVVLGFGIFGFYEVVVKDLPVPEDLVTRQQAVSTKIYDRHGKLLFKIYKNENRSIVDIGQLPKELIEATIAIEDSAFYSHNGISVRGILRAVKRNVWDNQTEGGSTITQQLVKNALLTPEQTITRKLKEIILAIRVELEFSKDEILQMYFNEVNYGGAAYGVEEASQLYFGKSVSSINLAEAALLAGLPVAPTTYSPFGSHPELAVVRQHQVLTRMVEENYISPIRAEEAKSEKLTFAPPTIDIEAPHFVMHVKDLLVNKYGEALVHQGGLEVVTSLDLDIQKLAEEAVEREMANLSRLNVTNAAVLVTHPGTGEVLAMVGSRNYFDFENDGQVNVTLRPRQPGSSIKVVTYALALENGFTPATIIDDSPIVYRIPGSPPYAPKNYDDRWHGRVTVRQALASSYNVPAVKTLSQFGVNRMIEQATKMGISTWTDPSRYGLSLTLGGGEVMMVDMATVYGVLANSGRKVNLNPILSVSDYDGKVFEYLECPEYGLMLASEVKAAEVNTCDGEEVLSPLVSYQLTDILSDNNARAPAFGRFSVLNIPGEAVAVKTGTSNSLRDNWTVGYSRDYVTAVWVGNNDNSPMSYVASGITGASPIWRNIMQALIDRYPTEPFTPPENLVKVAVCQLTGTRACGACPNNREEWFVPGTEPTGTCNEEMIKNITEARNSETGQVDRILEGISIEE